MDGHHAHPLVALFYLVITILGTIYAWINIAAAKDVIGVVAGCFSIVAGFMAIRYYYFAIKEKKQNLKK